MKRILTVALAALIAVATSAAADTLKVGVQAPITGAYANEGQGIDNAVKLLADQINAEGGVLDKKIEVVTCDDQGTAMAAALSRRGQELVA